MEIDDWLLAMDIMTKAYELYLKGEIGEESLLWCLEFSATGGCKEAQLLLDECKKYGVEKAMGKQQKKSTDKMTNYKDQTLAERRRMNAEIFRETAKYIREGGYTAPSGKRIRFDFTKMLEGEACFKEELHAVSSEVVPGGTQVIVEHNDCLRVAERMVKEGYNPLLLNFASAGHPGGGVENGARAQEETICRRSTLTRSIFSFYPYTASKYHYDLHSGEQYPITSPFSAIYSPDVTVFRDGIDCRLMENPYNVAVVTCAALNLNGKHSIKLTREGRMPKAAIDITLNKIRTIFRIGLKYGHDSLVLGAFGCGAFNNPPEDMAKLFHTVMEEPEFKDRFRLISFAIIDRNPANPNLKVFEKEFATAPLLEK